MPDFLNKYDGPVGWVRWAHRGVHRLDHIVFPKRQERYVHSEKFDFRVNTAFEQVVRACADPSRFGGRNWMVESLVGALLELHESGHAHSWETWMNGQLVAGVWGVQIGGFVNMASMYHTVSHASKAALGRGLLMLRERGFEWVDRGMVPNHTVDYGVEWWPRWRYERELGRVLRQRRSIGDDARRGWAPLWIRAGSLLVRWGRALRRKLLGERMVIEPVPPEQKAREGEEA
jgi:leucyl/phenylalanyl-tRNA--protein transferase